MQRNTRQREAIRAALTEAGRPLAPHEILEAAQEAVPGLGIATAYWTLSPPGVAELTPNGFELDAHEIVLYGRCRDCVTGA